MFKFSFVLSALNALLSLGFIIAGDKILSVVFLYVATLVAISYFTCDRLLEE